MLFSEPIYSTFFSLLQIWRGCPSWISCSYAMLVLCRPLHIYPAIDVPCIRVCWLHIFSWVKKFSRSRCHMSHCAKSSFHPVALARRCWSRIHEQPSRPPRDHARSQGKHRVPAYRRRSARAGVEPDVQLLRHGVQAGACHESVTLRGTRVRSRARVELGTLQCSLFRVERPACFSAIGIAVFI